MGSEPETCREIAQLFFPEKIFFRLASLPFSKFVIFLDIRSRKELSDPQIFFSGLEI